LKGKGLTSIPAEVWQVSRLAWLWVSRLACSVSKAVWGDYFHLACL
jgi:hypothetical protein